MDDLDECDTCTHIRDEHEDGGECAVEGCGCVYFEEPQ